MSQSSYGDNQAIDEPEITDYDEKQTEPEKLSANISIAEIKTNKTSASQNLLETSCPQTTVLRGATLHEALKKDLSSKAAQNETEKRAATD